VKYQSCEPYLEHKTLPAEFNALQLSEVSFWVSFSCKTLWLTSIHV